MISKFSVEMLSYLNLRNISEDFRKEINFLGFDDNLFNKFKIAK